MDNNHRPHFIASQVLREADFICCSKNSNSLQNRFFLFQLKEKNPGLLLDLAKLL
jgi:hypothetical protein